MYRRSLLLIPLLIACSEAPTTVQTTAAPIINGAACGAEVEPTSVAILAEGTLMLPANLGEFPIKTVICTGTLIAPDVVLTAAHCVDPAAISGGFGMVQDLTFAITFEADLTALAGGMSMDFPTDARPAALAMRHESFDIQAFSGVDGPGDYKDIGLLFLATPILDVEPEIVVTAEEAAELVVGAQVTIAGWGQQTPEPASIFMPPPPGTVGAKHCALAVVNEVGVSEFQVGSDEQSARKCHGDSGGPSYLVIEGGSFPGRRVVGITSHAYDMSDCAKGGLDTRVDTYLAWIEQKMVEGCTNGTRSWCDIPGIIPPGRVAPPRDGGVPPDAGTVADVDAGTIDSGVTTGGGSSRLSDDEGCTCVRGSRDVRSWGFLVSLLAFLGIVWPRRRRVS